MSNTPTTCTDAETVIASSTMNATLSSRTGTPRASAISASTEANSSGRNITPSPHRAAPANSATKRTSLLAMARILPNRILIA